MICCSCGKEIDINYGREYWNGIYCKKCADEMLSTPEYIKNYKRIIADLQAENAALHERLEKAVVLPCKVGDKVYIPWVWDNQSDIMETSVVTIRLYPYTRKYEIRLETDSLTFAQKYQYGNFNDKDFGTLIFTTREAAEARRKELQGEKN